MPVSSSLRMLQHLVLPSSLFDTHSHTHTHTHTLTCILSWIHTHSAVCDTCFYKSTPLVAFPGTSHPTPYSVNDLALGSPAAAAKTSGASFLLFSSTSPSSLINNVHQTPSLYLPPSSGPGFTLRPSVCPGPGESPGLLSPLLPQRCPLPHLATCSETHTDMWTRCASSLQTL